VKTTLKAGPFIASKAKAARYRVSCGKALSDSALQGLKRSQTTVKSSGVFKSKAGLYSAEDTEAGLDD
jgi:hypothetical protein